MAEVMMTNLYQGAKKIHRVLVIFISIFTLIMATTGSTLKYPQLFSFLDLTLFRYLHNQMSLFFSLTLFFMAGTGLIMYFYPLYLQKKNRRK